VNLGAGVHLTYCSNIHPGESWAEVRANFDRHVIAVRDRLVPDGDFGVGCFETGAASLHFGEVTGEREAEGDGFGVHAVAAAHHRGFAVFVGSAGEGDDETVDPLQQEIG